MGKLFRKINDILTGFQTTGLIARWELGMGSYEGQGATTVTDLTGNNMDGAITGAMSFGNGYYSVQGQTTEYIRTPDLNALLSPANTSTVISVFMWVYPTSNGIILCEQGTTTPDSSWYDAQIQRNSSNKYLFGVWPYAGVATPSITSTNTYPLNEWHYVGYTYDGTTLRGYVNGNLEGSYTVSRQSPYNSAPPGAKSMHYYLGYPTSTNMVTTGVGTGGGPKGAFRLGALHVYNTALTTAQVLANYNAQSPGYSEIPQTGLILHVDDSSYPGTGTTWTDLSGNSNSLTTVNTPTFVSSGTYSGGYFSLNGTNQHFTAPSGFADFTNGITVLSIVDFGTADNWERIIDFGQGQQDDNIVFAREGTTNTLTFEFYNGTSMGLSVDMTNGVSNGEWGFYGFRADGVTYSLFNATASTTGSSSTLPTNVTRSSNYVGRSNWSVDAYLQRYLGALAIYNRALTDDEIEQFYYHYTDRYFGVPSRGLVIALDANDTNSYSGSGTTVYDLQNGYDHTLTSAQFTNLNGVKCFDCHNANTIISVAQGTGPTLPTTGFTYITWARMQRSSTGYRTLFRHNLNDHSIIVDIGTDNLGFWDNDTNSFKDSGYDVTQIEERWVQYAVVGDSTSTTYYIDNQQVATTAFGAGGNTHWAWGGIPGQGFGHVANMYLYDRKLSLREIKQAYKSLKPRFTQPFDIVTEGLLLRLDANDYNSYPDSGSTWYDVAGTAQNMTLVNTPTFTEGNPAYLDFNGTNEYATGAGVTVPTTAYTKSIWFKLDSYAANNLVSSITGGHFMFFNNTQNLYSGHNNWPVFTAYPSTTTFSLNTWYCTTLSFNTTDGMKLYVNGVLDSTYTANKAAHNGDGSTHLGTHLPGGNLLDGKIAKVYTYDRAITAAEVWKNFSADREQFGI